MEPEIVPAGFLRNDDRWRVWCAQCGPAARVRIEIASGRNPVIGRWMTADEMEQHPDLSSVGRVIVGALIVRPIPIEWVFMPGCHPPQMLEPYTRPALPND